LKIEIRGVTQRYGKHIALRDLSLTLESPRLVGLVGPNGAGKSTLMKLLVSQLLPSEGEILVDDLPLSSCEKALKSRLGYLPQDFGLYEELTIAQFLEYMATMKKLPDRRADILRCLEKTGLSELAAKRIGSLSGGQKQRVGVAQALLGDPALTIVDEPTVGLDPEERIRFRNLFSREEDRLVLFSTHIIDDVQSICNRLIILNDGGVLFDGLPEELVRAAHGKVKQVEGPAGSSWNVPDWAVTSRIVTPDGVRCRLVGDDLPPDGVLVEPTLEDAYLYCLHGGHGFAHPDADLGASPQTPQTFFEEKSLTKNLFTTPPRSGGGK
jgi:ABC-type multidrug transport system ATPase subunit